MRTSIILAIAIFFFAQTSPVQAQHIKKHYMRHRTTSMDRSDTSRMSSAGAEVSGITGSAPGDPYNLNHPFFKGSPRWTSADSLYRHGDFPWALVSQHPEDFQFDDSSGQWQISNMANLGRTR